MVQRIYLIIKEVFSNYFISLIVILAITTSVFAVSLFDMIGKNFNHYIHKKFASSIQPNVIKVTPDNYRDMYLFQVKNNKATKLSPGVLARIRKMPGVRTINPILTLKTPCQVRIFLNNMGLTYKLIGKKLGIMGGYTIDAVTLGAPYQFLKGDIHKRYRKLWRKPSFNFAIPVILPDTILKAYNDGMAEPNGAPRISPAAMIGRSFTLRINYSSLQRNNNFEHIEIVIAGITNKLNSLSIILPIKAIKYYNKKYNRKSNEYLQAFIKVRSHKSQIKVSKRLKKLGLKVFTGSLISQKILKLKRNVNIIINALMYLIIFLAIVTISFSTIIATLNRIEYYRIMRIVGASKIFLTITIIIKYALIGLISSYIGIVLLKYTIDKIPGIIKFGDIKLSLKLSNPQIYKIISYGIIIPVVSTIPALLKLYYKGLNRD